MGGESAPLPKTPAAEAVSHAIEELGFGRFQLIPLFLSGGIFFAEGAEMLVMGSITSLLHRHWGLDPAIRGAMVSVVFIGFSVGNFASGAIGDRFGRRFSILLSYALLGVFGFATACSTGPVMMLLLRFWVGVGCGIGFPASYALMTEVSPAAWRSSLNTLMIGFMPLGELVAALGVLVVDPELDNSARGCDMNIYFPTKALMQPETCAWKTLCEMSAIPGFLFLILAWKFVDESPQFLAAQGRFDECEEVLQSMAQLNGKTFDVKRLRAGMMPQDEPIENAGEGASPTSPTKSYSFSTAVEEMMGPSLRYTVLFMCLAHVAKDFSVFGLGYMLPQYFVFLKGMVAGLELLCVAAISLPGVLFTFLCSRVQGVSLVYWMSGTASICCLFALGMLETAPPAAAAPSAYMVKLMALSYFVFTVVYTTSAFPPSIRQTAVGVCCAAGRAGSISAPLVLEMSKEVTGSFDFFICCLIVLLGTVAACAPVALPKWGAMDAQAQEAEDSKTGFVDREAKDYGAASKASA